MPLLPCETIAAALGVRRGCVAALSVFGPPEELARGCFCEALLGCPQEQGGGAARQVKILF